MAGWVKYHRAIRSWGWYKHPVCRGVFLHLLILANHEPKYWQGQLIQRGQCPVGRSEMSRELGFTEQQIRTAIINLESTNDITIERSNKCSIITIVNWETYQGDNQQNEGEVTSNQPAINPANNHTLRSKEIRNKEVVNTRDPKIEFDFEAFWQAWQPVEMSKGDKQKALKSFTLARKKIDHETLIRTATQYAENCRITNCKTKHVATWLDASGWEHDDALAPIAAAQSSQRSDGFGAGKPSAYEIAMADRTHR